MAYGHRGVPVEKAYRNGSADEVAPADDHYMLAGYIHARAVDKAHYRPRRARNYRRGIVKELACVAKMQSVYVLCRVYGVENERRIHCIGKRHLHDYAVYRAVGVEPVKQRYKLLLSGFFGKVIGYALQAVLNGRLLL